MKLGDTVYIFDPNFRVYAKSDKGIYAGGGPIYREHYRAVTIKAETTRSWILSYYDKKISKKTLGGCYTLDQVEEKVWEHDNRHKIVRLVERCSLEELHKIAAILVRDLIN